MFPQANWYLYAAERDEKDKDPKIEAELLGKAKTSYLKVSSRQTQLFAQQR